ncbi:MAG: hypothetical protein ACWGQW_01910 [bacterium]
MKTTYTETVLRYRVMRHDDLPEAHKEAYRAEGINPDEIWSLIFSCPTLQGAEEMKGLLEQDAASWQTFKVVDGGEATTIERPIW